MPTRTQREQQNQEGRRLFDAGLPAFANGWRALGYDPTLSFLEQVKGRRGLHPRVVAGQCVDLAAAVYGVTFTGRTRSYDVEHGTRQPVGFSQRAPFYASPFHVLAIALRKVQGRSQRTDDVDAPGLPEEILVQLRRLP